MDCFLHVRLHQAFRLQNSEHHIWFFQSSFTTLNSQSSCASFLLPLSLKTPSFWTCLFFSLRLRSTELKYNIYHNEMPIIACHKEGFQKGVSHFNIENKTKEICCQGRVSLCNTCFDLFWMKWQNICIISVQTHLKKIINLQIIASYNAVLHLEGGFFLCCYITLVTEKKNFFSNLHCLSAKRKNEMISRFGRWHQVAEPGRCRW